MSPHLNIDREMIAAFCRKWKIRELAFFGSVLRDDFRPDSDVDVLVEFEPGQVPGFAFITLQDELSELFGRKVDLMTRRSIERSRNWIRRKAILESAETFYVQG
jgi:uncharacterized protein